MNGEMGAYWPALVLEKSLAPSKVEQGQQYPLISINNDEYLIWLIGNVDCKAHSKDSDELATNFYVSFWVNQGHLYQFHATQLRALQESVAEEEFTEEFKSIFQFGMENNAAGMLGMFRGQIMADVEQINGDEPILPEGDGGTEGSQGVKRRIDNPNTGRNLRAGSGMSSFQSRSITQNSTSSMRPDTLSTQATEEDDPMIKQEPNEDDLLRFKEKVRALVGPRNTEFTCSKTNIAKSPVLSAYLIDRPSEQSLVMHPNLEDIEPLDFKYIVESLRTDAYTPGLVTSLTLP